MRFRGFWPHNCSIVNAAKAQALNQNLVSQLSSEANSRFVDTCASQPAGGNESPAAVACTYGDKSAQQSLVLYGDSYVEQWLPAFDALGKQYHFKVLAYVRYGCPFAAVPERDYLNSVDSGCAQFRHNVIAAINAMTPPPSLTILAELAAKSGSGAQWLDPVVWSLGDGDPLLPQAADCQAGRRSLRNADCGEQPGYLFVPRTSLTFKCVPPRPRQRLQPPVTRRTRPQ